MVVDPFDKAAQFARDSRDTELKEHREAIQKGRPDAKRLFEKLRPRFEPVGYIIAQSGNSILISLHLLEDATAPLSILALGDEKYLVRYQPGPRSEAIINQTFDESRVLEIAGDFFGKTEFLARQRKKDLEDLQNRFALSSPSKTKSLPLWIVLLVCLGLAIFFLA